MSKKEDPLLGINPYKYAIHKQVTGNHGAVVCAHPLAAKVGLAILRKGGNAMDAAIAVQFALAVVYPQAGNIGGGGFLVMHQTNGKNLTIDFRETAPSHATENMYIDSATGKADLALSQSGHLSIGIPGTIAGIEAAMRYAKLPLPSLIQPAIELAGNGFCITENEASGLNKNRPDFMKYSHVMPAFCRKQVWKAGDTLIQPELASTLQRIRDKGLREFYEGETAKLIVNEVTSGNGIISLADLRSYKAKERSPIEFEYRGYHIITMPPPSSGGILLEQMLKMLEPYPIKQYGFATARSVQLMVEVERRAYADRAAHLGDPDFYNVPIKAITSSAYLLQRMASYDSTKSSVSSAISAGAVHESDQTTHLSIIDREGNCVSVTTTLNGSYGSKTVVSGGGFLLNNEMDDFSAQPGVSNMYGAIGGKANAIAPGKRMLSSMTPTIILKDSKPFMILGTPGGTTIITSVLQSIINIVDFNMTAADAVNRPKFHHQWQPDTIYIEKGFSEVARTQLAKMGYKLSERSPIGRVELIKINDKTFEAIADYRGDDAAEGW